MRRVTFLGACAAIAAAIGLAAPAGADDTVDALMTGGAFKMKSKHGHDLTVTFQGGGVAELREVRSGKVINFTGTWFTRPDKVCFDFPDSKVWSGQRKCPRFKRDGDRLSFFDRSGEPLGWDFFPAGTATQTAAAAPPPARASQRSAAPVRDAGKWQAGIEFGGFHALVIGNNAYRHLPPLKTAVGDAQAVARVLGREYGFTVHLLLNATRRDILEKFAELRKTLTEGDNLLIYYAGHGILDEDAQRGYWLPVDADEDIKVNWVSNVDITDSLRAMDAWHVLVVADSCYSGTLVRAGTRTIRGGGDRAQLIKRLATKKSRTVLTSGGLEPVADAGGERHSVFAKAFLDTLRENGGVLEGQEIFLRLRQKVVVNADQTPEYSDVRKAGHDGGDFVFVRSKR
ncbi:MAG: caspase family protein [Hyphomicrobiales bacterium]|nr:caspase family protein [Hyphomicrobiales bacterium]